MTKALIEVDAFTSTVSVPEDDDPQDAASVETPFQALTNRSLNAKNRLDHLQQYARYRCDATALASGLLTLIEELNSDTLGGGADFAMAANEITVPAEGLYQVSLYGTNRSSDTTNPLVIGPVLLLGGTPTVANSPTRFSATAAHNVAVSWTTILEVTDVADLISLLWNGTGNLTTSTMHLTIRRVA